MLGGRLPNLGIRPTSPAAHAPASSPISGMRVEGGTVAEMLARLDPAPGVDRSAIEKQVSHVAAGDRSAETVRHIMSTMQYQMA